MSMVEDFGESQVTVNKSELLEAIKKNRAQHHEAFLEAQKGYREEAIRILDETLRRAQKGERFDAMQIVGLVVPQEHTRDYDRVIRMLEMSIATQVTITEGQFSQYVLDDWGWKSTFGATVARYSKR